MWRRVKQFLASLMTYPDLSPDLLTRRRINQGLQTRPSLPLEDWYRTWWQARGISFEVIRFVYTHLEQYSGLQLSRVLPSDRLNEDLQLTAVCWFDWSQTLCQDFWQDFGIDLSDALDLDALYTLADFVQFLDQQLLTTHPS